MSLRNLVLFLMFGGLFYGAYYLYRAQTSKPLQADLITIDTARISRLRIHPKDEQSKIIELQREGDYWIVSNGQVHLRALEPPVQAILRNLIKITTVDIAAKREEDWMTYGLAPSQAVRIEVYEGEQLREDFWIGQSRRDNQLHDSLAFIRIHQEQEIYAVEGLETYPFHQAFPIFRSKTLLSLPDDQPLDSFSIIFPDTTFTFKRSENQWQIGDLEIADATPIYRYLQNLRNVHADIYVDDFDDNQATGNKYRSLILYLTQADKPILINIYRDTLREQPYIIQSTQNPGTWFGSDSSGVYSRVFWDIGTFFPGVSRKK